MEPKFEEAMQHFSGSQTRYSNWFHIVWIPKYRHDLLTGHIKDVCEIVIRDVANQRNLKIQTLAIASDHVHILIAIPPKRMVCEVVQEMKSITAIVLRREFMPQISKYIWKDGLFWARGYYCSTVGSLDMKEVEDYIRAHQQTFSQ